MSNFFVKVGQRYININQITDVYVLWGEPDGMRGVEITTTAVETTPLGPHARRIYLTGKEAKAFLSFLDRTAGDLVTIQKMMEEA